MSKLPNPRELVLDKEVEVLMVLKDINTEKRTSSKENTLRFMT